MRVRMQEFMKEEVYNIIPTAIKNQYLGINYDYTLDAIKINMFTEDENREDYFIPVEKTEFVLSREETIILQRMITMLWNQSESESTFNKSFNIRNDKNKRTTVKLIHSGDKDVLVLNNLLKKYSIYKKGISFSLERFHCKGMYAIIRYLLKKGE